MKTLSKALVLLLVNGIVLIVLNSGIDVGYPDATMWMALVRFLDGQAQHAHSPEDLLASYHSIMRQRWARRAAKCRFATCYSLAKLLQHWY